MDYKIKLDLFQGPLDLLLNLIEKAEIDIYDIPINIITEQYMEYIYEMEELDLDIASDFILMASTLLQIKSKMLLPEEPKDDDEEDIDPREELVLRLLTYKKYKEAAGRLRSNEKNELRAYYKPKEDLSIFEENQELDLENLDLNLIVKSINNIIKERGINNRDIQLESIQKDEYSVKDCSANIILKLNHLNKFKFTDLLKDESTRSEIVAYFLSILELLKLQLIFVNQDNDFTDLIIIKREIGEH